VSSTTGAQADAGYDDIGLDGGLLPDRRELPAWAVSLGVHVVVLALLWMIHLSAYPAPEFQIDSDMQTLEDQAVIFATAQDKMGNETKSETPSPSKASATVAGRDPQKEFAKELREDKLDFPIPEQQPIVMPSKDDYVALVQARGETVDAGGTDGAVDILVREIERSLAERKTFVVWLFDASLSLNARRKQIADRFQNVYRQLNARNEGIDTRLTTAVVSFGEKFEFLTDKPVTDVGRIVTAVRNIKPDTSGREYTFTTVNAVLRKYGSRLRTYRSVTRDRRNVMFIIVTDERGDDYAGLSGKDYTYLDRVIRDLRRLNIRAYCVGNASLFGREKGYVSFTDETGYQWNNLEVDQGPETVAAERLQLPFWGPASRRIEQLSANYGPYALTRLCTETGGLFLIAEHSAEAVKFPADVMRKYAPFYGPIPAYLKQVQANGAKTAVYLAAGMTVKKRVPQPQLTFRADSEVNLRNAISIAQRAMAEYDARLREIEDVLLRGEKDRPKVKEDRWRASFDLAIGRVLAMRTRVYGYQQIVAEMSRAPKPFQTAGNNQWRLVPSANWQSYPPEVKKLAKKATMYLKRVVDEHPHTPWALLAEHELSTELGWAWTEGRMYIPPARKRNAKQLLLDEENNRRRKMRKKQAMRTPPKL
jgi:von Willebrand factor type A domain